MTDSASLPRIHQLSAALANQIAAGEVVERPASVVKELIENSLDAGARRIQVHIESGGSRLIRVQDDGCGIHDEDLSLALDRHATSKIHDPAELMGIRSLGFRGEALPSIGSVSRLILSSRYQSSDKGWTLRCDGSNIINARTPVAHNVGTTVEVQDLFYNTPARRKFLRTDKTEFGHIQERIQRLALSRFDVGFELFHNQREVYRLRPATDEQAMELRIARVLGKPFMQHALRIDFEASGLRLWGWLATADFNRSSSLLQYFYVNGRAVRDKFVNHAIRHAYEGSGFTGSHPAYVMYLELSPELVDVNVHPAKHEVRFRDSRLLHDFICSSVDRALRDPAAGDRQCIYNSAPVAPGKIPPQVRPWQVGEDLAAYTSLHNHTHDATGPVAVASPQAGPLGVPRFQLKHKYLICENNTGMVVINISAARRAILRQSIREALSKKEMTPVPLIMPVTVSLQQGMANIVENNNDRFTSLGMVLDRIGENKIIVRQLPSLLGDAEVASLVIALAQLLASSPNDAQLQECLVTHGIADEAERMSARQMSEFVREVERNADESVWSQLGLQDLEKL
ncbi:MAG: DNA mismatch repair endonuclease MutL [Gammaproteobacteria bacterium]|nr:MAG: DNA mismatch repair endonuclease MutL [Gammaproteobacteria bacterium]